jgi:glycerol-3-phosphate dehydrogenase
MRGVPALRADVLVIGGGATGAGVAWDAALRGFDVMLVERGDLAEGTSGRFHGLLHSGGRYVVKDPVAAEECVIENKILREVIPDCIEDTGGLFVSTPDDDPAYGDRFLEGCRKTELPVQEISVAEALRQEPRLNPGIRRAFTVPDASIDAWKTVWSFARGAAAHGARILTYHRVTDLHRTGDAVTGARVRNELTGEDLDIEANFVLNASGAWAAQILHMAGIEDVGVVPGKGIMIAMNHRLVNTVINRCTMPADGDILVPIRTVSVIGTTDIHSADPDEIPVTQAEVDQMLDDGERLVPGFRDARALRVWAGVRPLFQDAKAEQVKDTRDVGRSHAVLDHSERDGLKGFITMTGGKWTTFRLMAQDMVDAMCHQLGEERPCRTREQRLPGSEDGETYQLGHRLRARERELQEEQLVCECELISRSRLETAMRERGTANLDDIRRNLRLGMGPCQGGFCIYRATGMLHAIGRQDGPSAAGSLVSFLQERWKGVWPILYGDQLRQARLDDWIYQGALDVEHAPATPPAGAAPPEVLAEATATAATA